MNLRNLTKISTLKHRIPKVTKGINGSMCKLNHKKDIAIKK